MRKMMEYQCLTCALTADIDLADDTGRSDDSAERKHMKHDGAHKPNWVRQEGDDILSPYEDKERLGLFHDFYCGVSDGDKCNCPREEALKKLAEGNG